MNGNELEALKVINNYRMREKDTGSESYEIFFIIIINFKLV